MEMVGAILFAVLLYVITIGLWRFVARRSRRAVLQRGGAGGNGGRKISGSNSPGPALNSTAQGGGKRRGLAQSAATNKPLMLISTPAIATDNANHASRPVRSRSESQRSAA